MDSAGALASAISFLPALDRVVSTYFAWFSLRELAVVSVAVCLYYAVANKTWQNIVLLLLGSWIVWLMSPVLLAAAVVLGGIEWMLADRIARSGDARRRARLLKLALAVNVAVGISAILCCTLHGGRWAHPGWLAAALDGLRKNLYFVTFGLVCKSTLCLDARTGKLNGRLGLLECLTFQSLFTRYSGIPTDRARDTVPQLLVVRRWDAGRFGTAFWLCMTGFLKLSIYRWVLDAYTLLEGPGSSGAAILLGASIQLLGIWLFISGRVDLARSFAFLFGIRLAPNFDAPFESRNPAELWRRWNITLGAWLNEEIFIKVALALRRWKGAGIAVACLVAFLFCGALHGPIATNLAWGGVHGCYMAAYMLSRKRIRRWSQSMGDPRWLEVASVLLTFSFFVASSFLLLSSSMRSTARAIRSVWVGPFWPHQCQEVRWLPFAAAACVAMLLHSLPRRMGGEDAWLSSLGLRARICVGVAMAAGMFVAVSWA